MPVHYKDGASQRCVGNNCYLFYDSYQTHKYDVWTKYFYSVNSARYIWLPPGCKYLITHLERNSCPVPSQSRTCVPVGFSVCLFMSGGVLPDVLLLAIKMTLTRSCLSQDYLRVPDA